MPAVTPARTGGAQPCPGPPAHSALLELDAVPYSARLARAWARQALRQWRLDALADDSQALIAEMTANAVDASAGLDQPVIRVALTFGRGELAILVSDGAPGLPEEQEPDVYAESGRGLLIVAALSDRYGWYPLKEGSVVWAVLRDPAAPPPPGSPPEAPAWPGNPQPGPRRGPVAAAGRAGLAATAGACPVRQPAAGR